MRFFIGAIVSSLILSPVLVLSTAIGAETTDIGANFIEGSTQTDVAELQQTPTTDSTLEKRFCIRRSCREKKRKSRTSGFQCRKKYFSPEKIERARAAACPKIKENKQQNSFPSLYTASNFDIEGPYLEWPISRNGRFYNRWSRRRYRIILTKDCKVVAAVMRGKNSSYSTCEDLRKSKSDDDTSDDDE